MSRGVALIAESAEWADSEDLHRRIDELQILNKQHIKNEGINIIAYLHSKPQIYSLVAVCQSIASAPIQQLVLPFLHHSYCSTGLLSFECFEHGIRQFMHCSYTCHMLRPLNFEWICGRIHID